MTIRQATAAEYGEILALNELAIPAVNFITEEELAELHRTSCYLGVAMEGINLAGFLLVLREGSSYASLNYQWFSRKYNRFAYIDRIVVSAAYRRRGVGKHLYQDLLQQVDPLALRLTCEVNLEPPNPVSIAFHQQLGFSEVDQQRTAGGTKLVSLMVRPL